MDELALFFQPTLYAFLLCLLLFLFSFPLPCFTFPPQTIIYLTFPNLTFIFLGRCAPTILHQMSVDFFNGQTKSGYFNGLQDICKLFSRYTGRQALCQVECWCHLLTKAICISLCSTSLLLRVALGWGPSHSHLSLIVPHVEHAL